MRMVLDVEQVCSHCIPVNCDRAASDLVWGELKLLRGLRPAVHGLCNERELHWKETGE